MATSPLFGATAPETPASITVLISPVIERYFRSRDLFPELRLENAVSVRRGNSGVHQLSIDQAKYLLGWALTMRELGRGLPRGSLVAYGALVRRLQLSLQEEARRGLLVDPRPDDAQKRAAASPACFEVGDTVLYFYDADEYGEQATIVGGYKMYVVLSDNGPHISDDGKRVEYRYGYMVKTKGLVGEFFVSAHRLTRDDCRPAHLCLVASRSTASHCAGA